MLQGCSELKALVTSRVRLDIYGEHEYVLPPMSTPPLAKRYDPRELGTYEAVQLFLARTQQHRPAFNLTAETATAVAAICQKMEGVPLAIELAAARTRTMEIEQLALALGELSGQEWLGLLDTSARNLPPRQRTLYQAIAWSYRLLSPHEQRIFRRTGIFVGGFDLAAATAVCAGKTAGLNVSIETTLKFLADHNLLGVESLSPARWWLLEMIRVFALAELSSEEEEEAARSHATFFARKLQQTGGSSSEVILSSLVKLDYDNCRAALEWAIQRQEPSLALPLAHGLGWYCETTGRIQEGRSYLSAALALPGHGDAQQRIGVLHKTADLAWMQLEFQTARKAADEALAMARTLGDQLTIATLLNVIGRISIEQGDYDEASTSLRESEQIARHYLKGPGPSAQLIQLGEVELARGRLEVARGLLLEGLAVWTGNGASLFVAMAWTDLAEIALAESDYDSVREALVKALPHAQSHIRRLRILVVTLVGHLVERPDPTTEEIDDSVRLLGFAAGMGERTGDPLSPMVQSLVGRRVKIARPLLKGDRWRTLWNEGWSWTQDQAVAFVYSLLDPEGEFYE